MLGALVGPREARTSAAEASRSSGSRSRRGQDANSASVAGSGRRARTADRGPPRRSTAVRSVLRESWSAKSASSTSSSTARSRVDATSTSRTARSQPRAPGMSPRLSIARPRSSSRAYRTDPWPSAARRWTTRIPRRDARRCAASSRAVRPIPGSPTTIRRPPRPDRAASASASRISSSLVLPTSTHRACPRRPPRGKPTAPSSGIPVVRRIRPTRRRGQAGTDREEGRACHHRSCSTSG